MLTLLSVRLVNWRMIKDATFSPLTEGITGIAGRNGAGKSTFLDGLLWALYGVRPEGVNMAGLRRERAAISDECSVTVEFMLSGQHVKVYREIRGKGNTNVMHTFLNGHEATKTSVGPGERWIREHLKIDSDGFLTAFVIRQKELDSLVTARPAERRTAIERLSGIERMSNALAAARKEANDAKRLADALPGTEDDVFAASQVVSEHEVFVEQIAEKVDAAREDGKAIRMLLDEARANFNDLQASIDQVQNAEAEADRAANNVTRVNELLNEALDRLSRAESAATGGSDEDLRHAQEEVSSLRAQKNALISEQTQRQYEVKSLRSEMRVADEQVESLTERAEKMRGLVAESKTVKSPTAKQIQKADKSVEAAREVLVQASDALAENRSQITSFESSLATLRSSVNDQCCPTCKTVLDDPQALIASFESSIKMLLDTRQTLEGAKADAQQALNSAESDRQELESKVDAYQNAQESILNWETEIVSAEGTISALTIANETRAQKITVLEKEIVAHEDTSELDQLIATAEESLAAAMAAASARAEVQAAQESVEQRKSQLAIAEKQLEDAQQYAGSLVAPSDDDVEFAQEAVISREAEYEDAKTEFNRLSADLRVAQERLSNSQRDLERAEKAFAAKRDALADLSQKTSIADLLDEFRKAQVARIAPEMSETATSLISAMTNGKYTEVVLDEDFTPSVINVHGEKRPVTWLSGGEVSVVALALRIAIADLITGSSGGMLCLDEILTAQDAERRSNLIDTLRSREGAQIIMINHTQEASDIVDKTVNVVEEDGGSIIIEN